MKNLLLSFIILLGLVSTGCRKTNIDTATHKRIVGQYRFEKVTIYDGFISTENITNEYSEMILQLNNKREAALIDTKNGITYIGNWHATEVKSSYTDDDGTTTNTTYFLDIYVAGDRGQIRHFAGRNATINPHRLKFTVDRADGCYKYKLKKL